MAGKNGKGKKDKGKGDVTVTYWADTVAVILKRDCAEALYAALVVALGTLPSPKKKKKKDKKKTRARTKARTRARITTRARSNPRTATLRLCALAGKLLWLQRASKLRLIQSR
jgi:hypothetical protein